MQALILAGGEGTRLRPLTINTPKPIVPIGNEPFLVRQILALKSAGIHDITLSLNYQPTAIEKVIGDGSNYGVNLRYIVEPAPMGTAGAYKFAANHLKETTLVLNGDILTDLDLLEIINHHQNLNADATIFLTGVENPSAYGLVQFDEQLRVVRFLEKPSIEEIEKLQLNTINAGIYVLEPNVLELIPDGEKYSFEYQLFPNLLDRKAKFYAFVSNDNYWLDIGTPTRYLQANLDLMNGKYKSNVKLANRIDNSSIIGKNGSIKNGAEIISSIVGESVIIGANAVIKNSVIWRGAKIGENSKVVDSIVGFDSEIEENCCLDKGMISDGVFDSIV
ncbi:MAG TPA: NDP-sugar synthase [Pyrinomonadaceae bacterium]|nr:NDP-sugar synthase [Pyrinomonadaceae bacterium]